MTPSVYLFQAVYASVLLTVVYSKKASPVKRIQIHGMVCCYLDFCITIS